MLNAEEEEEEQKLATLAARRIALWVVKRKEKFKFFLIESRIKDDE